MSELSQRLSQVRNMLDDLDEADKLVDSIGDLLAQRNALREQLRELGTEIATKRQAVEQEVAALDADLATRQRAFTDEIARMEEQTATAKAEQARTEQETSLSSAARADGTRAGSLAGWGIATAIQICYRRRAHAIRRGSQRNARRRATFDSPMHEVA